MYAPYPRLCSLVTDPSRLLIQNGLPQMHIQHQLALESIKKAQLTRHLNDFHSTSARYPFNRSTPLSALQRV